MILYFSILAMSCKNQEKSRSQPFLSRHATLVSSSLPDETKPYAFFLQTVPDSIIFEIPNVSEYSTRTNWNENSVWNRKIRIKKKILPVVASSAFVIFIVLLFFCFENSEVWLFWEINIIFLDWIIWRADYNISRPRGPSLCTCRIIRIINIIKVAPQLLGINMKICYDPRFIDIRVTMATYWRHYVFYLPLHFLVLGVLSGNRLRVLVPLLVA